MTRRSGLQLGLSILFVLAQTAFGADEPDPSALCDRAIANGARRGGVPIEVLYAVALSETGRPRNGRMRAWPWAINREGKGHWFDDRTAALAFARKSLATGRTSFDVGCVQINYRWHGHAFPSIEAMFDPEWSATYAAQFLRTLYEERGTWAAAAGAYHSLTPELAHKYSVRFSRMLAGINPADMDAAEQMVSEIARHAPSNRRNLRAKDDSGSLKATNLLVPAAGNLIDPVGPLLRNTAPKPLIAGAGSSLF